MVVLAALTAAAGLSVIASPAAVHPDSQVHVTVTGLNAPSALVVLHGGIARRGKWFHWVPLRADGGGRWTAILKAPGLLGIYPVHVRVGRVVRTTDATVEVVPPRFTAQPGFAAPEQVAQWWAFNAKPGVMIKSVTTWRSGFFTHRDPVFNRLLRVQFRLLGNWPQQHLRPGEHVLYLSVARRTTSGAWRLLETVAAP